MIDYGKKCSTCSKYLTCQESENCGERRMLWEPGILFSCEFMKVLCISERRSCLTPLTVGKTYFVRRSSIYMDCDGDAYGEVYADISIPEPRCLGNLLMKHFQTV